MTNQITLETKVVEQLVVAHQSLIRAYVNLLETGRDRIMQHGGTCDQVDVMEANDPALRESKAAITAGRAALEQGEAWHLSKDGLPTIGTEVIGGHFYQDTWLKGKPTVFLWGRCTVVADDHPDFAEGKRWQTFGPSHNDITHWSYPPSAPGTAHPQASEPAPQPAQAEMLAALKKYAFENPGAWIFPGWDGERITRHLSALQSAQPVEASQPKFFVGTDMQDGVLTVSVLQREPDCVAVLVHHEEITVSAQPVAQPLTIEAIKSMDCRISLDEHIRVVRMTEAAHDIKKARE